MLILNLLFGFFLTAQTVEAPVPVKVEEPVAVSEIQYQVDGELALESRNSQLGPQRNPPNPNIQNLTLGLQVDFNKNLQTYFEILGEQSGENNDIYFGEIFVDYKLPFYQNLLVRAGNTYYDYGLLTGLEGLLSSRPSYYSDLLVTRRGIDLGVSLRLKPFQNLPIEVAYSHFAGTTYRTGDKSMEKPIMEPRDFQVKYSPSFMEAKFTYLKREYVSRPQFSAFGLSVKSQDFTVFMQSLRFYVMAEIWNLDYRRNDQLQRKGWTHLVGSYAELSGFFHRLIIANENWRNESETALVVRSDFVLNGLGYKINEHLSLEYQRITNKENSNGLRLTMQNEDVYRIFFTF